MARKRMLAPEFFTSKPLSELPIPLMVTFAGLWCYVDDQGRGEDDVALVKATVWPRRREISEVKVEKHLTLLDERFLICRYIVAEYPLLHVINWREHQKISHPTLSKLPPCAHHDPHAWEAFASDSDPTLDKFRSASGGFPENLTRRSGATPRQGSSSKKRLAKSNGADGESLPSRPGLDLVNA